MFNASRYSRHPVSMGTGVVYACAGMAFLAIVLLFLMIAAFALPVLIQSGTATPFGWVWMPARGQFGILPMVAASVILSVSALVLALPVAVAVACWIIAIGKGPLLHLVNHTVRFMTTIPTVVYGFVAIFLLTPIVRQALGGTGMSWFTAALMLAVLILPTMVLVMVAGIQPKLESLCPSGLALGFSKLDLLWFFVLSNSKKTLLSAAMLGLGRAIGDTLLPLMLAGNATQLPHQLSDSIRALTAHMALVTANEVGGAAYNSLFAAGLLLLLINVFISMAVKKLGNARIVGGVRVVALTDQKEHS